MRAIISAVLVVAAVGMAYGNFSHESHFIKRKTKTGWEVVAGFDQRLFSTGKGGVYVEMSQGTSINDRVYAIVVPYDKFKDDGDLIIADITANVGLLAWRGRWNTSALNLASPDATEILVANDIRCEAIDVVRLMRSIR